MALGRHLDRTTEGRRPRVFTVWEIASAIADMPVKEGREGGYHNTWGGGRREERVSCDVVREGSGQPELLVRCMGWEDRGG